MGCGVGMLWDGSGGCVGGPGGPSGCDRWFRFFEASGVVRLWASCEGRRGDVGRSFWVRGTTAFRTGMYPCVLHGLSVSGLSFQVSI